jgi:MEMO1 family protein
MVSNASGKSARVRPPAVAGLFYPGEATQLADSVDGLLLQQPVAGESTEGLRALICPHAGYQYSGPIAGTAFAQVRNKSVERVLLMGPSHRVAFCGVALAEVDEFETPLGRIPLADCTSLLAHDGIFVKLDAAHEGEHSLEVQLPFLQRLLNPFSLVPLVFGDVDELAVAETLRPWCTPDSLLVASTDLSHYQPYDKAVQQDRTTIEHILRLEPSELRHDDVCGRGPVRTLLHLARAYRWHAHLLDYKNSGDTAGDKYRVVGYTAIAFYE